MKKKTKNTVILNLLACLREFSYFITSKVPSLLFNNAQIAQVKQDIVNEEHAK